MGSCEAEKLQAAINVHLNAARHEADARCKEQVSSWAERALCEKSGKGAFRYIKGQALSVDDCMVNGRGGVALTPLELAEARRARWSAIWHEPNDDELERAAQLYKRARALALEEVEVLDPLQPAQLRQAAATFRRDTALGTDWIAPDEILQMPMEGWEELAGLYSACERAVSMPLQVVVNLMATLPKPAGGERQVACMGFLVRLWTRARKWQFQQWSQSAAGFWDAAVRGSSALRATLIARFGDESAFYLGATRCSLLADIEKFF